MAKINSLDACACTTPQVQQSVTALDGVCRGNSRFRLDVSNTLSVLCPAPSHSQVAVAATVAAAAPLPLLETLRPNSSGSATTTTQRASRRAWQTR